MVRGGPLLDQLPPRSDETVTRLTSALITQIRRSARTAAYWFLVPIAVLGIVIAVLFARSSDYTVQTGLAVAAMLTFVLALPVILMLRSKLKDVPTAIDLVRNAPVYQGDPSDRQFANVNMLIVTWREDERDAIAYLRVPYHLRRFDGEVTVFAARDEESVGFLLGEQDFYLSVRATRLFHIPANRAAQ